MGSGSLEYYSSFVRSVGGRCTLLRVIGRNIFAGSHNGDLACWEVGSGSEKWRLKFDGPCSSADFDDDFVYLSESNSLHCIEVERGEIIWSSQIEGSCDLVKISKQGIWVTSSVYGIETQDYFDSAVWLFDCHGELVQNWPIESRSWSLEVEGDFAIVALSRPKCGFCTISLESGVKYQSLECSSPVTIGIKAKTGGSIFGHSDGNMSYVTLQNSTTNRIGDGSVTALALEEDWIMGTESGQVISGKGYGSWKVETDEIVDLVEFGPSPEGGFCVWASSWSKEAKLSLFETHSGKEVLRILHDHRVPIGSSEDGVIALGDFSGSVFVLEEGVIRRRKVQSEGGLVEDKKSELLRRKIRRLRTK